MFVTFTDISLSLYIIYIYIERERERGMRECGLYAMSCCSFV